MALWSVIADTESELT